ncbi:MAG TPA: VOC family protein [Gaiellaceae bacterium]|nr:VOC family protein [Gaiellaceae bacterium]
MELQRVLETVLYHSPGEEDELGSFYGELLGLHRLGKGLTFRIGPGVLLLFDRERSTVQATPPPHGASGAGHTCFVAAVEDYERWRERLTDNAVPIVEEREWDNGVRSFYFHDPAGNVLEIANGDLWPRS